MLLYCDPLEVGEIDAGDDSGSVDMGDGNQSDGEGSDLGDEAGLEGQILVAFVESQRPSTDPHGRKADGPCSGHQSRREQG